LRHFRCAACGAVQRLDEAGGTAATCARCRRALATTGAPQRVDAAALVTALRAFPGLVLVHFAADLPSPALARQAGALAGVLPVLSLDPSKEPAAAEAFRVPVTGQPAILGLYAENEELARLTSAGEWPGLEEAVRDEGGELRPAHAAACALFAAQH
jgi:thioredoxin 2